MPDWAQKINIINPIAYFIRMMRMIMLKGSQLQDILKPLFSVAVYAVISLTLAVWRYRKVSLNRPGQFAPHSHTTSVACA